MMPAGEDFFDRATAMNGTLRAPTKQRGDPRHPSPLCEFQCDGREFGILVCQSRCIGIGSGVDDGELPIRSEHTDGVDEVQGMRELLDDV